MLLSVWSEYFTDLSTLINVLLFVIGAFLAYLLFKLLSKLTLSAIILAQLLSLTLYISAVVIFVGIVITAFVALYNRLFDFATYISTSLGTISCLGYMLDCAGIVPLLTLFFNEVLALFVVVIFIRASVIFYIGWHEINMAIWRLGVLLGLV